MLQVKKQRGTALSRVLNEQFYGEVIKKVKITGIFLGFSPILKTSLYCTDSDKNLFEGFIEVYGENDESHLISVITFSDKITDIPYSELKGKCVTVQGSLNNNLGEKRNIVKMYLLLEKMEKCNNEERKGTISLEGYLRESAVMRYSSLEEQTYELYVVEKKNWLDIYTKFIQCFVPKKQISADAEKILKYRKNVQLTGNIKPTKHYFFNQINRIVVESYVVNISNIELLT